METRRTAVAAVIAIALLAWSPASAQYGYGVAVETMQKFLNDWVIDYDEAAVMAHFGETAASFAPHYHPAQQPLAAVWDGRFDRLANRGEELSGYWIMLSSIWFSKRDPESRVDVQLQDVLVIDEDVREFLTTELSGDIVHDRVFLVFAAHDAVALNSFDAGYGNVAGRLQPSREDPTLTMIAGFGNPKLEQAGPFVSFWDLEEDTVWRIQALGAYPKY